MVVFQASNLGLPQSSPTVTSLLFHPPSLSLALMHSDSSFSLYPSLSSPFSLPSSSLPPPQTVVPPPTTSATFLCLQNPCSNPNSRHLFLTSSPLFGGSSVLFRFYILVTGSQSFVKARVICSQRDLRFDDDRFGVVFGVNHGLSVKLIGSINVFAMHSVSNRKIWVFAVKMMDCEEDGATVKLMRCAVVDCCKPVFSISVSFGFLLLGEENGVRVFPLRPLVKGRVKKQKKVSNGTIQTVNGGDIVFYGNSTVHSSSGASVGKVTNTEETADITYADQSEEKIEKPSDKVKSRPVKLRQNSTERGAHFVALRKDADNLKSSKASKLVKTVSIQAMSPTKFLILDSVGDLHLLCLSSSVYGSETCHVMPLTHKIRVHKLAVLSDVSMRSQIIWISDGQHTVHVMVASDIDALVDASNRKDYEEKPMQIEVEHAIFASEKVHEVIPVDTHTALILGQGSITAYAIC